MIYLPKSSLSSVESMAFARIPRCPNEHGTKFPLSVLYSPIDKAKVNLDLLSIYPGSVVNNSHT